MRKLFIILITAMSFGAKGQKIDSIFFNLYTDSLKKGTYNYINVDGKLSNGSYQPLTTEVEFTSSFGKWDGNNLIIEREAKVDSVLITAVLKNQPHIKKAIVIYLKKIETEPELKTEKELLEEWQRKTKKKSKKDLA